MMKTKAVDKYDYFRVLTDIFLNALRNSDYSVSRTISNYVYKCFQRVRKENKEPTVIYPRPYYELVNLLVKELASGKIEDKAIEYRAAGGIWLLGEFSESLISDATYQWLWLNNKIAIQGRKDSMVVSFWENAEQYFRHLRYKRASLEYSDNTDSSLYRRPLSVQTRFLEFTYMLGALLLYEKRYSCLKRVLQYTTSHPPDYVLLPKSIDHIFFWWMYFQDPQDVNLSWISSHYSFPGTEGMHADDIAKASVANYLALLYVRYFLSKGHLYRFDQAPIPTITSQTKLKMLIDDIPTFRDSINSIIENDELLQELGWYKAVQTGFPEHEQNPMGQIDIIEQHLRDKYKESTRKRTLSEIKIEKFKASSIRILQELIDRLQPFLEIKENFETSQSYVIHGLRYIEDKDAFAEKSEIDHINYDSHGSSQVRYNVVRELYNIFEHNSAKTYLLKVDDFNSVLKQLQAEDELAVIGFGVHYDRLRRLLGLEENKESQKETLIVTLPWIEGISETIFVTSTKNIPKFTFESPSGEMIERYKLEPLIKDYNLYYSIVDLNKASQEIRDEIGGNSSSKDLRLHAAVMIELFLKVQWKKDANMAQLKVFSEYRQEGLPNSLSEVEPLSN